MHGATLYSVNLMNSVSMPVASSAAFRALSVLLFLMGDPDTPSTFIYIISEIYRTDISQFHTLFIKN
jgi:hypothetical protein